MVVAIVTTHKPQRLHRNCVGRRGMDLGKVHLRIHQRTAIIMGSFTSI